MELIHLRTVLEVHKAGSLSKASMRLDKPQSIISRHLAAFERECGGRIFYRNGRGVEPTELGELVLPEIEAIIESMERMVGFSSIPTNAIAGDVRVFVSSALGKAFISKLYAVAKKEYPLVRLQFFEGYSCEIDSAFESGDTDVAVLLRNGTIVGPKDEPICQFDTYLVGMAGDPVLARQEIFFSELEGLPLLMPSEPSLARYAIGNLAASRGIPLTIVAEVNSPTSTQALLESGAGYLLTPIASGTAAITGYFGPEFSKGRLQGARICDPDLKRTLVVASNSSKKERVEKIRKAAVEVLRSITAPETEEPARIFGT